MVQTHDVSINGQGYMIVPSTYRYENVGAEVSRFATGVPSFDQRLGREATLPSQDDRDRLRWTAVGMMPVPVGIGDELGRLILAPAEQTLAIGAACDGNTHICLFGGVVYWSYTSTLYKATLNGSGQLTGFSAVSAAAGAITSMCVSGGLLYMATTGATMSNYAGSGTIANTPAVAAQTIWDYARGLWRSKKDAVTLQWDTASGSIDGGTTWTDFRLDSSIRAVAAWHGRVTGGGVILIGTAGMLWELVGQWSGSPAAFVGTVSPVFDGKGAGNTDDFAYLCEYEGFVYTCFAGTICRWNGVWLEPVPGAPRGTMRGICAAGGYLAVAIADGPSGTYVLSLYDGVRWTILARNSTQGYGNLGGTAGIVTDGALWSNNQAVASVSRWELPLLGMTNTPRASGQVIVGPLDAGAGDTVKTWTQIAVPWSTALYPSGVSAPANPGGNLLAEYSLDDGSNYVSLGTVAIANAARSGLAQWTLPQGAPANAGVQANRLLVRITWTPTSTYAGLQLDGVFASGWKVSSFPRHERWTVEIHVTDKLIKRDGSVDARSGETMLLALRALAQSGAAWTFQDIDFDLNARNVTCRIASIEERERKGDGTHFLDARVKVVIEAVA